MRFIGNKGKYLPRMIENKNDALKSASLLLLDLFRGKLSSKVEHKGVAAVIGSSFPHMVLIS